MHRKAKVLMSFIKDDIPAKITLGGHVYSKMQASGFYPSPKVSYADMLLIQNDLANKVVGQWGGTVEQYAKQTEAEKNWDAMMRKQAEYVNFVADGDMVKLGASGFPTSKTELERWHVPQMKQWPQVAFNNKHGGVDIKTKGAEYAIAYNYLFVTDPKIVSYISGRIKITPKDGVEIVHICSTRKKLHVKDLTKGKEYYAYVYPVGSRGMGDFPPPVSFYFPG